MTQPQTAAATAAAAAAAAATAAATTATFPPTNYGDYVPRHNKWVLFPNFNGFAGFSRI